MPIIRTFVTSFVIAIVVRLSCQHTPTHFQLFNHYEIASFKAGVGFITEKCNKYNDVDVRMLMFVIFWHELYEARGAI